MKQCGLRNLRNLWMKNHKRSRVVRTTIALLTIALLFALCVMGQAPNRPAPTLNDKSSLQTPVTFPKVTPEMTSADVEAFLDGIVPLQLGRNDIAGATIAVVKDGKLLFAKGYGYAEVKN